NHRIAPVCAQERTTSHTATANPISQTARLERLETTEGESGEMPPYGSASASSLGPSIDHSMGGPIRPNRVRGFRHCALRRGEQTRKGNGGCGVGDAPPNVGVQRTPAFS